jgi:hypothetical protein
MPEEYCSQPVALTAATIGPSCSIDMMVLSVTIYLETLVLFEMKMRSLVLQSP